MIIFGFIGALIFNLFTPNVKQEKTATQNVNTLNINTLNIVDKNGRSRIKIGLSNEDSPAIWFFDQNGVTRLNLGLYADGSGVYGIQDKMGNMIQLTRSFGENEVPLTIFKHKGTDSMIIGLNPSDLTPFLMNYDENHQRKIQFGKYDGP
jgi:hypothetical protein